MKYYLGLDKGFSFSYNERYIYFNLESINPILTKDNNLRALAEFTCTFNTIFELKHFLMEKGILNSKNSMYDLVICYNSSGHTRTMPVAYSCDAEYIGICKEIYGTEGLNVSYLRLIINAHSKSKHFLECLVEHYKNYKMVAAEIEIIKASIDDPYASQKLYNALNQFFYKLCKNGKKYNYRNIYDLGMYVSLISNRGRGSLINSKPSETENLPGMNVSDQNKYIDPDGQIEGQVRWF